MVMSCRGHHGDGKRIAEVDRADVDGGVELAVVDRVDDFQGARQARLFQLHARLEFGFGGRQADDLGQKRGALRPRGA